MFFIPVIVGLVIGSQISRRQLADFNLDISFRNLSKIQYVLSRENPEEIEIHGQFSSDLFSARVVIQPLEGQARGSLKLASRLFFEDEKHQLTNFLLIPVGQIEIDKLDFPAVDKRRMAVGYLKVNGKSVGRYLLIEEIDNFFALKKGMGKGRLFSVSGAEELNDLKHACGDAESFPPNLKLDDKNIMYYCPEGQKRARFLGTNPNQQFTIGLAQTL